MKQEVERATYCTWCALHHSQNSLKRRSKYIGWLQRGILQTCSNKVFKSKLATRYSTTHDDLVRDRVQDFSTDDRALALGADHHRHIHTEAVNALRLFLGWGMKSQKPQEVRMRICDCHQIENRGCVTGRGKRRGEWTWAEPRDTRWSNRMFAGEGNRRLAAARSSCVG